VVGSLIKATGGRAEAVSGGSDVVEFGVSGGVLVDAGWGGGGAVREAVVPCRRGRNDAGLARCGYMRRNGSMAGYRLKAAIEWMVEGTYSDAQALRLPATWLQGWT
jgi:hypothetical protein